ncbi:MAG: AEC family transporter [Campylobacteraceae bacterium]|jgi:predicted permease|nr:AEC family transporter [Campylobacteraceae bacterium]
MSAAFLAILPIFTLIVAGCAAKRLFVKDERFWDGAEKFVYYLFFPALLILDITDAEFVMQDVSRGVGVTIASTLIIALLIFAVQLFAKSKNDTFTSIFQGGIRYNSYIFIALSNDLFGTAGVALSGIFIAYMIVITNVLSVIVLNRYGSKTKKNFAGVLLSLIKNPLILSVIIALFLNALDFRFSGAARQTVTYFAAVATPLSLMSVGAGLMFILQTDKTFAVIYSVTLKLIAMPITAAILLNLLNLQGTTAAIALLYCTLPCAANSYILSKQMGGDSVTMASIITWSTIASAVTIPVVFWVVGV